MARRRDVRPPTDFRTIIRLTLSSVFATILVYLSCLRYLNPLYVINQRQRKLYYVDQNGNILCKPNFFQSVLDLFQTDGANQRKLLAWVREVIPGFKITNFSTSWQDGIALCSLVEAISPGACPRHDLLKPHHRVNNCRLGLKLAHKNLQVPQGIITPEELAIADDQAAPKIRQLLTVIKWAAAKQKKETPRNEEKNGHYLPSSDSIDRVAKTCLAKGNGLLMGLVGKRCKFHIYADTQGLLDLQIEIKGANNEICSEKIMSLFPTRRMSKLLNPETMEQISNKFRLTENNGDVKYFEDGIGNTYVRQKSVEVLEDKDSQKIPFDYQCVGEGKYLVSYVPRSSGKHSISIFWHGHHITGSPFIAKIAESAIHLERQFSRESQGKSFSRMSYDSTDGKDSFDKSDNPSYSSCRISLEKDNTLKPVSRTNSPQLAAIARLAKQGTVTRRRVLRRVVTRGGRDVTITDFGATPDISRQNSLTRSVLSRQNSFDSSGEVAEISKSNEHILTDQTIRNKSKEPLVTVPIDISENSKPIKSINVSKTEAYAQSVVHEAIGCALQTVSIGDKAFSTSKCVTQVSNQNTKESEIQSKQPGPRSKFVKQLHAREDSSTAILADIQQKEATSATNTSIEKNIISATEKQTSSTPSEATKLKTPPDSPSLRVLQSNSLNKVCYFVSHPALTQSLAPVLSQDSISNNQEVQSIPANTMKIPSIELSDIVKNEHSINLPSSPKHMSSPNPSTNSRRGSLVRQDVAICQVLSQESQGSSEGEKCSVDVARNHSNVSTKKIPKDLNNSPQLNYSEAKTDNPIVLQKSVSQSSSGESENKPRFECISNISQNSSSTPTWFSSQILIRIPTAKTDKWTQVSYDEIKMDTGWVSPMNRFQKRKSYQMIQRIPDKQAENLMPKCDQIPFNGSNRSRSPFGVFYGDNIPEIVYDPPLERDGSVTGDQSSRTGHNDVQQWLHNNRSEMLGLQPVRQSTVETVDSGISDSRCSSPGRAARRQRHIISNTNGQRLRRHQNQEQIELDPKHLPSGSNTNRDDEKENNLPVSRPRRGSKSVEEAPLKTHSVVTRTYSDGRRQKPKKIVPDDSFSLSDTELKKGLQVEQKRQTSRHKISKRSIGKLLKLSKPSKEDTATTDAKRQTSFKGNPKLSSESFSNCCTKLSANQLRKMKFRRRSVALTESQGSIETSVEDAVCKLPSPVMTSEDEINKFTDTLNELVTISERRPKDASARRRSYGGTSTPRKRLQLQRSSTLNEDAYCGFGLSQSHRDDLLSEITMFSNLHEGSDSSELKLAHYDSVVMSNNTTVHPNIESAEVVHFNELLSGSALDISPETDSHHDIGESQCCDCELGCSPPTTCSNFSPAREFLDLILKMEEEKNSSVEDVEFGEDSWENSSVHTNSARCRALGAGLQSGFTETPINFQVLVDGAGDGHLTVGIKGPTPNTVRETSITYTGDNLYEVIYYVTHPGYYAIDVKWSDQRIPDSPFISRVTL